jgi:hypothetical protein
MPSVIVQMGMRVCFIAENAAMDSKVRWLIWAGPECDV